MQKAVTTLLLLFAATIIFMAAAFYNGYPLVTSDTGSYIKYAFDFQVPADRSPFYGVFVGVCSFWLSLWFTVAAQCFLLAWVLHSLVGLLAGDKKTPFYYLAFVSAIAALTPACWVSAFVMPDIFAALLLLGLLCYLHCPPRQRTMHVVYLGFIAVCTLMHNSHFLILPLFAALAWLVSKPYRQKAANLILLSVGLVITMCSINYSKGFGFTLSAGSHVFMMGKLSETGILEKYLDDNCDKTTYTLCDYKHELPSHAWDFLWDEKSPLYKTGGWDSSRAEYSAIIKHIFTTPRYATMFAGSAISGTAQQLLHNSISVDPLPANAIAGQMIAKHYPQEFNAYTHSLQTKADIPVPPFNYINLTVFVLSSGFVLIYRRHIFTAQVKYLYIFILLFLLCNAFVTATFANVLDRLQVRASWVLPAVNIWLLLAHWFRGKYAKTGTDETQIL